MFRLFANRTRAALSSRAHSRITLLSHASLTRARFCRTAGWPSRPFENQAEVVRRHFNDLVQHECGRSGSLGHRLKVPKTPRGILRTKIRIELLIALRSVLAEAAVRPVEEQDVLGGKQSLRAFEQCWRGGPRSDVNQVDAHHRSRRLQRPRKPGHVKINGRFYVCQVFLPDAQRNGLAKLRIWIGWLPNEAR